MKIFKYVLLIFVLIINVNAFEIGDERLCGQLYHLKGIFFTSSTNIQCVTDTLQIVHWKF